MIPLDESNLNVKFSVGFLPGARLPFPPPLESHPMNSFAKNGEKSTLTSSACVQACLRRTEVLLIFISGPSPGQERFKDCYKYSTRTAKDKSPVSNMTQGP